MTQHVRRIGVFGGSFNPLHQGHLILAEFAAESIELDRILFAPVLHPPHKDGSDMTLIQHRLAMIEMAIADNKRFELSLVDVERPGPHYSVDTVKILEKEYPNADLYFLMGGDSFKSFTRWHRPYEIIEHCCLAVMRRPSSHPVQPDMHEKEMPGLWHRVKMVEAPPIGISSTRIREQLLRGRSVRYLVPNSVLRYIHQNNLYQG